MDRPVNYEQFDRRWANVMYSNHGDAKQTIRESGCGPTCAAMAIATLRDNGITPVDTCKWAVKNGHRTYDNGTNWAYFRPQLAAFGIECDNYTTDANKAIEAIRKGYMVIALALKGLWTSSGHYILAYGLAGSKILINDPFSTAAAREKASLATFKAQCSKFWIIKEEWQMDIRDIAIDFIDGKNTTTQKMPAILYKDENYVRLRDIGPSTNWEVGYDAAKKRPKMVKRA